VTNPTNPGRCVDELPAGAEAISDVPTSVTAFVGSTSNGPVDEPTRVRSIAEFERVFGAARVDQADGASLTMPLAIGSFFENGGTDAVVVRPSGQIVPPPGTGAGIYALDRVDAFNLLCLPDLTSEFSGNAGGIAAALAAASAYCEARRAILIVDPMPSWRSVTDVLSGTSGVEAIASALRRTNAVLYFPAVVMKGRDGLPIECGPSGAVAGVIARTDATHGVWRAPAGETAVIAGVVGPALSLSDDDVHRLSAVGVNALRTVPSDQTAIWGARTLEGATASDPEWNYINIRRFEAFLERSIDCGLRWVVFEPNDEPLWAAIRTSVGVFLSSLHRRGAFQGATAREAYFVKCGHDTMSRDEIDSGVVNVIIGFAAVRPAEFIVVKIRQAAQDHDRPTLSRHAG